VDSAGAGVALGDVRRQVDERLVKEYRDAGTQHTYYDVINDLHTRLQTTFGRVGDRTDFSTKISAFASALTAAAQNTASSVNRQVILNAANDLVVTVQRVTTDLQNKRAVADQSIEDTLLRINQLSEQIHQDNAKIYTWQASRFDTTDLEDQRDRNITELSGLINISVSNEANGAKWISTSQGLQLVDSQVYMLNYKALSSIMRAEISQAGGSFQPIELLGQDVTTLVTGGQLKALIDQRDQVLPDLQAQVNAFTLAVRDQTNEIHNLGSVFPGASSLTSTHSLGESASATNAMAPQWSGVVRVAVVDGRGRFNKWADIDLSTTATVGSFVTALNAALGYAAATVTAEGSLTLAAPSGGYGIAVGQGCDSQTTVTVDGKTMNFSHFFGFNDFFVTSGTTILDTSGPSASAALAVRSDMVANPMLMALSQVSSVATPSTSISADITLQEALSSGDTAIINQMWSKLTAAEISFGQAGSLGPVTTTFAQYGGVIVSQNAVQAKYVMDNMQYYKRLHEQLEQNVLSISGVNVDLELQRGEEYRDSYAALARVYQTTGRMMDELLNLPRR